MKYGCDLSQTSTIRGLIWVSAAAIGLFMLVIGHKDDIGQLMILASGIAGGLGVAVKD